MSKTKKKLGKNSVRDEKGRFIKGHKDIRPPDKMGGRPKGSVSITTELKKRLEEIPPGQRRTFLELLIDRILRLALEGKTDVLRELWRQVDGMPRQKTEITGELKTELELTDEQFEKLIRRRAESLDSEKGSKGKPA